MTRGTFRYIGQRLVFIALTVFVVSSIVFVGIHRLPGDAFFSEHYRHSNQEALLLHHYGLDQPLLIQYKNFIANVFTRGDLGESLVNRGTKLTPLVLREATVSAEVGIAALIVTIGLGMLLGVIAAIRHNTWVDYLCSSTAVVGYSLPNFVIASVLMLVFGVYLYNWTNGAFYYPIGWDGTYGTLQQIPVPAFALGFPYASFVARLTRASMLEVIGQDYIRTARAKG